MVSFVTLKEGIDGTDDLLNELKRHVATKIGSMARPDDIFFTAELPRHAVARSCADCCGCGGGTALGDTTTLADPGVVEALKEQYGDEE